MARLVGWALEIRAAIQIIPVRGAVVFGTLTSSRLRGHQ